MTSARACARACVRACVTEPNVPRPMIDIMWSILIFDDNFGMGGLIKK